MQKKIGEKKGLSNDVSNRLSKNSGGFGVGGTNWLQIGSIQNKTQKNKIHKIIFGRQKVSAYIKHSCISILNE